MKRKDNKATTKAAAIQRKGSQEPTAEGSAPAKEELVRLIFGVVLASSKKLWVYSEVV